MACAAMSEVMASSGTELRYTVFERVNPTTVTTSR